ncbi:MAG: 16S rRNA processing protein RimM [Deltaproteobacteria bacterium]|nr:16S rRNA processing protein RimM [Deltaproteobacteria bacterium]
MTEPKGDEYNPPELIRVGYVAGAHGVHGAIRVRLDNPKSVLMQSVRHLSLVRGGQTTEYRVIAVQFAGQGTFKIALDGVASAQDAASLRGAIIMVATAALPPTSPREFYYFETVGCRVVTTAGAPVGIVEEVFSTGANDVWVVRDRSLEHLVPVIEGIVKEIDLPGRQIIIEAVPGLLE